MSKLLKALDFPETLLQGQPQITLLGNKQVFIDGCGGILEYGTELIKISCGKYTITLEGDNLNITELTDKSCSVSGNLSLISFI